MLALGLRPAAAHSGGRRVLSSAMWAAVLLTIASAGCQAPRSHGTAADAICQLLADQAAAWNRGDIPGYMQAYWDSDQLTFSSGGKTVHGRDSAQAAYERRYPTPERMGRLSFSDLQVRPLGPGSALVLGRWHLEREAEPMGGNFSLVVEKVEGSWRITHDHTSQLRE